MATVMQTGGEHREHVYTEVYSPVEVVLSRIVYYVFGVIEVLLALRFVFGLFAANAASGFVKLIYGITDVFMAPFTSIFGTQHFGAATIEWSVLVAIVIYALIAWGLVALIRAVSPRERVENVESERTEERDEDLHVR